MTGNSTTLTGWRPPDSARVATGLRLLAIGGIVAGALILSALRGMASTTIVPVSCPTAMPSPGDTVIECATPAPTTSSSAGNGSANAGSGTQGSTKGAGSTSGGSAGSGRGTGTTTAGTTTSGTGSGSTTIGTGSGSGTTGTQANSKSGKHSGSNASPSQVLASNPIQGVLVGAAIGLSLILLLLIILALLLLPRYLRGGRPLYVRVRNGKPAAEA